MTIAPHEEDYDDYSEWIECTQCWGEGGYNSCMEDTCCAIGGEEGCTDPLCWRTCFNCKGKGGWTREEPDVAQADAGIAKDTRE